MDHRVWSGGLVVGLIHDLPICAALRLRMESEAKEAMLNKLSVYSEIEDGQFDAKL